MTVEPHPAQSPPPSAESLPAVDDHFIREGSRLEAVGGIIVVSPPADAPHATLHFSLAYVLGAHVAPGWQGAVDMLTRTSHESDFAPDASVFPAERDPGTGGRRLEELAFEIAATQPLDLAGEKARELLRRGVRRVFCIVVKHLRVLEWSRATDGWSPLADSAVIADRCFVRPLPVRALVRAAAADDAVVAALIERGHPQLAAIEARGEARGEASGLARGLVALLEVRGFVPTERELAAIHSANAETLGRWLEMARTVSSVTEIIGPAE